jgi:putative addiction module component (TIGR02574 family)
MQFTVEQIESAALSLPRPERARILDALVASLEADPEVERAWIDEIRRRIRDIDRGVTQMIPGDEVLREIEEVERAWDEEDDRRHRAFLAGELSAVPAKEALAKLRRRVLREP